MKKSNTTPANTSIEIAVTSVTRRKLSLAERTADVARSDGCCGWRE
jgi:hypothetical protein